MYVQNLSNTVLRTFAPSDVAVIADIRRDHKLQHQLMANPDPEHLAEPFAEAKTWIAHRENNGWFQVIDNGCGAVGFVQIANIHRKNRFGWLGIALIEKARGQGLGARALAEAEVAAANQLLLRILLLKVRSNNNAALALYQRAGWRRVGLLSAHYDDGLSFHDVLMFEKHFA
jgi:RimJ/RimL family protein N-acetyltransferase